MHKVSSNRVQRSLAVEVLNSETAYKVLPMYSLKAEELIQGDMTMI